MREYGLDYGEGIARVARVREYGLDYGEGIARVARVREYGLQFIRCFNQCACAE